MLPLRPAPLGPSPLGLPLLQERAHAFVRVERPIKEEVELLTKAGGAAVLADSASILNGLLGMGRHFLPSPNRGANAAIRGVEQALAIFVRARKSAFHVSE